MTDEQAEVRDEAGDYQRPADWVACGQRLPPDGVEVMTKIDDGRGVRNEQTLVRQGGLWFTGLDYNLYVYYTPTHWKALRRGPRPGV